MFPVVRLVFTWKKLEKLGELQIPTSNDTVNCKAGFWWILAVDLNPKVSQSHQRHSSCHSSIPSMSSSPGSQIPRCSTSSACPSCTSKGLSCCLFPLKILNYCPITVFCDPVAGLSVVCLCIALSDSCCILRNVWFDHIWDSIKIYQNIYQTIANRLYFHDILLLDPNLSVRAGELVRFACATAAGSTACIARIVPASVPKALWWAKKSSHPETKADRTNFWGNPMEFPFSTAAFFLHATSTPGNTWLLCHSPQGNCRTCFDTRNSLGSMCFCGTTF